MKKDKLKIAMIGFGAILIVSGIVIRFIPIAIVGGIIIFQQLTMSSNSKKREVKENGK